jgi:hypothetical protein
VITGPAGLAHDFLQLLLGLLRGSGALCGREYAGPCSTIRREDLRHFSFAGGDSQGDAEDCLPTLRKALLYALFLCLTRLRVLSLSVPTPEPR